MHIDTQTITYTAISGIFLSVVLLHFAKRSSWAVGLYSVQSCLIVLLLCLALKETFSWMLVIATAAIFVVKVMFAPRYFAQLIRRHEVKFSASTYLNGPATIVALAILTALTHAQFFHPLTTLAPIHADALLLTFSTMLISVFLIINRKGAISQMVGILSLENAIVAFATMTGLEQTPALQLGIVFDIFIWIVIATVFAGMIYQKFGSLDVSTLTHLTEE